MPTMKNAQRLAYKKVKLLAHMMSFGVFVEEMASSWTIMIPLALSSGDFLVVAAFVCICHAPQRFPCGKLPADLLSSRCWLIKVMSVSAPMDFTISCRRLQNRRIYHNSVQKVYCSAYHHLMNRVLLAAAFLAIPTTILHSAVGSSRQWSR